MLFSGFCLYCPLSFPSAIVTWSRQIPRASSIKPLPFYSMSGVRSIFVWNVCYFLSLECVSLPGFFSNPGHVYLWVCRRVICPRLESPLTYLSSSLVPHCSQHLSPATTNHEVSCVMVDLPKELSCLPVAEDRCLENMAGCVDEAMSRPLLLDSHGILFFHMMLLQGFKFKISNGSLLMDAVVTEARKTQYFSYIGNYVCFFF